MPTFLYLSKHTYTDIHVYANTHVHICLYLYTILHACAHGFILFLSPWLGYWRFFFSPQDDITVTFKAMLFSSLNSFLLSWGPRGSNSSPQAWRQVGTFTTEPSSGPCLSSLSAEVPATHHEAGSAATFCLKSESGWSWLPWQWWPAGTWEGGVIASSLPLLLKPTVQEVSDMPDWQIGWERLEDVKPDPHLWGLKIW